MCHPRWPLKPVLRKQPRHGLCLHPGVSGNRMRQQRRRVPRSTRNRDRELVRTSLQQAAWRNGQIYDENAITAANRTLPLGSLVRVTNLQTGQSAMMRITDRGPFVPNRILDLSVGAAKEIGVWRAGTARVRMDVYESPKPISEGGAGAYRLGHFRERAQRRSLKKIWRANMRQPV